MGGESQCKFDFSHRVEEVPEETDSVVANEVSNAEIGSTASAEQFYDSLLAAIDRLEESNYVEEESCYMKGGDCRHVFVQFWGPFVCHAKSTVDLKEFNIDDTNRNHGAHTSIEKVRRSVKGCEKSLTMKCYVFL